MPAERLTSPSAPSSVPGNPMNPPQSAPSVVVSLLILGCVLGFLVLIPTLGYLFAVGVHVAGGF